MHKVNVKMFENLYVLAIFHFRLDFKHTCSYVKFWYVVLVILINNLYYHTLTKRKNKGKFLKCLLLSNKHTYCMFAISLEIIVNFCS